MNNGKIEWNIWEKMQLIIEVKWSMEERKNTIIIQFFLNVNLRAPQNPRDSFFGGRIKASRLFYKAKEGEKSRNIILSAYIPEWTRTIFTRLVIRK